MEKIITTENKEKNTLLESLFSVGAHFGYTRRRRHPSITPYIFGVKNKVELFDLEKVSVLLEEAVSFVENLGVERKQILFVGGKNEAQNIIIKAATEIEMPYVAGRWIGGSITNFSEIRKRINRLEELIENKDKGEFEGKYTKMEILLFSRERDDLKRYFGGLIPMRELPKAMFVIDTQREKLAVTEARLAGIPVVALMNSDCDVSSVEYPMVGNDTAIKSIEFFTEKMVEAYKRGLSKASAADDEKKQSEDTDTKSE